MEIPKNILLKRSYVNFNIKNIINFPFWMNNTIEELFNYIRSTDLSQMKFLELEIKLGMFNFNGTCKLYSYINDIIKLPKIEKDPYNNYQFNSQVNENQFYALWSLIEEECRYNPEIIKCEPLNFHEVMYKSQKRKSTIYTKGHTDGVKGGQEGSNLSSIPKKEVIIKQDKSHFDIRNNGNDMRITICKEFPTDITIDDIAVSERNKFRVSYKFGFFRIDFTIVNSKTIPDDFSKSSEKFEIEFELIGLMHLAEMTNNFQKFDVFEGLLKRFIENVLCFYYAIDTINFTNKKRKNI